MKKSLHKESSLPVYGFLVVATLAVYWPVLNHEFVKYDDDKYVTENPNVKHGITRESVVWAFTSPHFHMWHPLTSLSHLLDCQLFGLNPTGHHLTNLLLHIASTLLLFAILKRMTEAFWPCLFVALAFAVHPLNVESVAWIAERKNVLSALFWILTIAVYVRYTEHPGLVRFLLLVLVFALATLTKPIVVTLPFALLLLDYWPLGRLRWPRRIEQEDSLHPQAQQTDSQGISIWRLLLEKIPLFLLTIGLSAVTYIAQQKGGVMSDLGNVPLKYRAANALVSYATYIRKMVWPSRLAVFYPHPFDKLPLWQVIISALLLLAITIAVILLIRRRKFLAVGWLWFIGTLVPVIGMVQVGAQARADRYTYLPFIGLFIMIAWGLSDVLVKWRKRKIALGAVALVVLLALSVCTRLQLRHWRNNKALFEHALNVTGDNFVMSNNYANILKNKEQLEEAIEHFDKALQLRPNSPEVHNNLGNALGQLEKIDEAVKHYKMALKLRPNFAEAHYNLAVLLARLGKTDEAIASYREALRYRPKDVDTLSNLGFALARKGEFNEAIEYYKKALELEPGNIITHGRLGLALAAVNRLDEAIEHCRIVLKAQPEDVEMHCNVGILLDKQGKTDEAIKAYRRALQINPDYIRAKQLLKTALSKQENQSGGLN
ncbi:MAG: tetratricopeptide repeat protein [Planctomycetota bacterium]|jgi:Flp pilus assembly protein TadD